MSFIMMKMLGIGGSITMVSDTS